MCVPRGAPTISCPLVPPVFLSFFGIASIGLSCLVALFLYHVVFGVQYLGILNGVAAFVIVGIGELPPLPQQWASHLRALPQKEASPGMQRLTSMGSPESPRQTSEPQSGEG